MARTRTASRTGSHHRLIVISILLGSCSKASLQCFPGFVGRVLILKITEPFSVGWDHQPAPCWLPKHPPRRVAPWADHAGTRVVPCVLFSFVFHVLLAPSCDRRRVPRYTLPVARLIWPGWPGRCRHGVCASFAVCVFPIQSGPVYFGGLYGPRFLPRRAGGFSVEGEAGWPTVSVVFFFSSISLLQ